MKYGPRSTLVHQEEPSTHVVIILSGWTKVTRSATNGYEALLALREPGDIVGEASAVSGRTRSATVTALGEVEAVTIERDGFLTHLSASPATALHLLGLTADRTRASDRQRVEQGALGVRERLALLLLDLARTHGEQGLDRDGCCSRRSRGRTRHRRGSRTGTVGRRGPVIP